MSVSALRRLTILLALLSFRCGGSEAQPPGEDAGEEPSDGQDAAVPGDGGARELDARAPVLRDAALDARQPPKSVPADAGEEDPIPPGTDWCRARYVLTTRCAACHDGQGTAGAPMPLVRYADTQALHAGEPVYRQVGRRVHDPVTPMPPSGTLAKAELAALDTWLAGGAEEGDDAACAGAQPPTGLPTSSWPEAECDEVYRMVAHGPDGLDQPYPVPAGQEIHPQVFFDAPWGDESVQAIAFRSRTDNSKVLHHWILYNGLGAFLTGWAPGGEQSGASFPPTMGMDMPRGPRAFRLDMHYFNVQGTQVEPDQSGVEVCIVRGARKRPISTAVTMGFVSFGNRGVMVEPGAQLASITGRCDVLGSETVHLMSATPHAHTYARRVKFTVQKKDGSEIVMHDGPFVFAEQQSYPLLPEVLLEQGDRVLTSCYYTNDTTRQVTFGESTTNEMCFNFAMYYPAGALRCAISANSL